MLPASKIDFTPWLISSEPDGDFVLRDDAPDEIKREWRKILRAYQERFTISNRKEKTTAIWCGTRFPWHCRSIPQRLRREEKRSWKRTIVSLRFRNPNHGERDVVFTRLSGTIITMQYAAPVNLTRSFFQNSEEYIWTLVNTASAMAVPCPGGNQITADRIDILIRRIRICVSCTVIF